MNTNTQLDQQQYIEYQFHDNTILLATAGSGKTFCMIERVKKIIEHYQNICPMNHKNLQIICISFTRSTVQDIKSKLDTNQNNIIIKTFDALGLFYINKYKNLICQYNPLLYEYSHLLLQILKNQEFLEKEFKEKDVYLFVDEAQDINEIQYDIIKEFQKFSFINIIGDEMQSIYQFRGSSPQIFLQLQENTKQFILNINRRCSQQILQLCRFVISKFQDCGFFTHKKVILGKQQLQNDEYQLQQFEKEQEEIDWIVDKILYIKHQNPLSTIAILCRHINTQQKRQYIFQIEKQLNDKGIKLDIKFSNNQKKEQEQIIISSIHYSKGLEWDYVFLPMNSFRPEDHLQEEENRLLYVSITRAKKSLYITYHQKTNSNYNKNSQISRHMDIIANMLSIELPIQQNNFQQEEKFTTYENILYNLSRNNNLVYLRQNNFIPELTINEQSFGQKQKIQLPGEIISLYLKIQQCYLQKLIQNDKYIFVYCQLSKSSIQKYNIFLLENFQLICKIHKNQLVQQIKNNLQIIDEKILIEKIQKALQKLLKIQDNKYLYRLSYILQKTYLLDINNCKVFLCENEFEQQQQILQENINYIDDNFIKESIIQTIIKQEFCIGRYRFINKQIIQYYIPLILQQILENQKILIKLQQLVLILKGQNKIELDKNIIRKIEIEKQQIKIIDNIDILIKPQNTIIQIINDQQKNNLDSFVKYFLQQFIIDITNCNILQLEIPQKESINNFIKNTLIRIYHPQSQ